ncbi:SH3-like domain-containing protein [Rhodobium orientis]|nr:SH3-like domain-containing protein [Rhodobium orientis]
MLRFFRHLSAAKERADRRARRKDKAPRRPRRIAVTPLAIALAVGLGAVSVPSMSHAQNVKTGPSGLPLPRFVSLKSDRINVRRGPGRDHAVSWVFVRAGLPVEVVQEFENWRRIRDSEGEEGWVFHSLLSGRRSALVAPWEKTESLTVHREPDPATPAAAFVQPGVLANVYECDGTWCRIGAENWSGWIDQTQLWGVYPDEKIK